NFVAAAQLEEEAGPSPHERPYFFFAGRLVELKGLDDVIPVFREFPGADLVIAGEGEDRAALERTAAGARNIRFRGWLSPSELMRWYRHAHAVVFPSLCWEQFPMVWLEALAAGAPVIARRRGSATEFVTASGGGELFESAEELRTLVEGLLANPEGRRAMVERGRQALVERWTDRVVLPRYFELIGEAASRRGCTVALRN